MARLARASSKNPKIRAFAGQLLQKCRVRDFTCEARALFKWVQHNIRWTRDIEGVETVQTPERTLEWGFGDCDDLSTLVAGLALSVGIPVKFRAVAADPRRKGQFSHVYVMMDVGVDEWAAADPSRPDAAFGWETPRATRKVDHEV